MLKPYHHRGSLEAGCDEAGRGCIAGPVFAAAVVLPEDYHHPMLDDSKRLSARKREILRNVIEKEAVAYGVGVVSEQEIDEINILNASFLAMHRAIGKMGLMPEFLLIDGNRFTSYSEVPHICIVKGDGIYASIAAASILAKTNRDQHMEQLHREYPQYGWNSNKGYPTKAHRRAVLELGPTLHHRRSFRLLGEQLHLDFS